MTCISNNYNISEQHGFRVLKNPGVGDYSSDASLEVFFMETVKQFWRNLVLPFNFTES